VAADCEVPGRLLSRASDHHGHLSGWITRSDSVASELNAVADIDPIAVIE